MPAKSDLTTETLVSYLTNTYGEQVKTEQLLAAADYFNVSYPTITKRLDTFKAGRGKWNLTVSEMREQLEHTLQVENINCTTQQQRESLIPSKDKNFVPFGNFADLKKVINSGIYYPIFITGLSGNGKTLGVEQA